MSNAGNRVGEEYAAVGTGASERQLSNGSMATSNYSGRFYEAARAGRLFHCDFGVTATGLVISGIGTSQGAALFNPVGSTINASIISVRLGMVSSTLILGTIMHAVNTNLVAAATTGTTPPNIVPALAGSAFKNSATPLYTATLPANPTPCRVFFYKQPTIATGNSFVLEDLVDGAISLMPGATWSMFTVGNDTSPLWKISVTWIEEVI